MKSIKLEPDALWKGQDTNQNTDNEASLKDIRKKQQMESKNRAYDPQINKIETKNYSPARNSFEDSDRLSVLNRMISEKTNDSEEQKQSKLSLKLPAINGKIPKKNSFSSKNGEIEENLDYVKENKFFSQVALYDQRKKTNSKGGVTEQLNDSEKVSSFLKYIQIKAMKPAQKSAAQKNDTSSQDIRMIRQQKSIPLKLNKTNDRQTSPNDIDRKSSDCKVRSTKKNAQKSQKVISNYAIRKQKKVLSISQGTQPLRQRKGLTNTYYDFCNFICVLNKIPRPVTPISTYKAFVAKGNNSILIKNSLKSRFWWNIVDSDQDINLFWAQTKDPKFIDCLKCFDIKDKKQSSEKKTIEFNISKENKQVSEKVQQIRDYTNAGLNKFLSEQQRKQYSKSSYQVQLSNIPNWQQPSNPNKNRIHNHLQFHWHISNKKALYYNLKKFYTAMNQDPFLYIPLTFHIQKHGDTEWQNFVQAYLDREKQLKKKKQDKKESNKQQADGKTKRKKQKNLWIVKPGQNSNQGNGIQVFDNIQQIADMVKSSGERPNGKQRSYIVQRYLMPFLYNKRKFDIRCYVLVTSINGIYKAYWYEEGYIRTSSKQFTLKNLKNRFIHLTNDAVQKKSQDYGKFQNGNKISFIDFQKYIDNAYPQRNYKFFKTVYPQMIKRAADAIKSTCMLMDSKKREFTFQIFGLDFMIDQQFATWLIQVNTNPCLELSSPLLARIIPNMVENALKIAVDPLFPPPRDIPKTKTLPTDIFQTNKFTLIFNSSEQQEILSNLIKDTNLSNIVESDEEDENHDDVE